MAKVRTGSRHVDRHAVSMKGDLYALLAASAEWHGRSMVDELRAILMGESPPLNAARLAKQRRRKVQ